MGGSVPNPQHHMGPWPGALFQYPPPYGQHPLYYGHQPQQQPPPPPPPPLPQYGAAGGSGAGTAAGSAAGPLVSFPVTDGWPVHLPLATVAEGQRELQRQRSLRLPIVSIIPHAERTRLLQEKKLHADNKSELVLPYNELPPKQTLVISEYDQMDPARSARQLRIALTCDSTAFTDTMDTLARKNRMAEVDK